MLKNLEDKYLPQDDEILNLVPVIRNKDKFLIEEDDIVVLISDYDRKLHNFFRKFKKSLPLHRYNKLDKYGSFVWLQIDGVKTVKEIFELFNDKFDDPSEEHKEQRVFMFLDWLAADYIDLYNEQKEK